MKKRKASWDRPDAAMAHLKISKQFLIDLLTPFHPIPDIQDIQIEGKGKDIYIFHTKGGVLNTS